MPSAPPRIQPRLAWPIAACLLVVCVTRAGIAGGPADPRPNRPVCTAAGDQTVPVACSDGAGGMIVAWQDARNGNADIYVQRISASRVLQWTVNGVAVCTDPGAQEVPSIVSDGAGGAIVAWKDSRNGPSIYAQRVSADGVPLWSADGVVVSDGTYRLSDAEPAAPPLVGDGSGGAIAAWSDSGATCYIRAQRIGASGAPMWSPGGAVVSAGPQPRFGVVVASDMAAGGIVAFHWWTGGGTWVTSLVRVPSTGVISWGVNFGPASPATLLKWPQIGSDGFSGAFVVALDQGWGMWAARVGGGGAVYWSQVSLGALAPGQYTTLKVVADGNLGAFVACLGMDYHVWVIRLASDGSTTWRAPLSAVGRHANPAIVSDGSTGAVVVWQDNRNGDWDIYAQRIVVSSSTPQWPSGGVPVATAQSEQTFATVAPGSSGQAAVAWIDHRNGPSSDIYADAVGPRPLFAGVSDIPNDQGGKLRLTWDASCLDTGPGGTVDQYLVWRQVPAAAAQQTLPAGASLVGDGEAPASGAPSLRLAHPAGAQTYYWENVATIPAYGLDGYSYVAATTGDSIAGSNPKTLFFVQAWDGTAQHWDSYPDSGYSVDNLPPATPAPFVAQFGASGVALHWGASREADLSGYRVYRGTDKRFVPGPQNLLSTQPDTGFFDPGGGDHFIYKLSAVDVHGNESWFACFGIEGPTVALAALVGARYDTGAISLLWSAPANPGLVATLYRRAPGTEWRVMGPLVADGTGLLAYRDSDVARGSRYGYRLGIRDGDVEVFVGEAWVDVPLLSLALYGARPNPVTADGLHVRFALPSGDPATLALYDVSGRRLRVRDVSALGAGDHEVDLGEGLALRAGVYLIHLGQAGRSLTTKAVVTR